MSAESYLRRVLIAFDQVGNAITGGVPDETISARLGRATSKPGRILDGLLGKLEMDHGIRSLEATPWGSVDPHHLPPVYTEIAFDWDCLVRVLKSPLDLDAFDQETLAAADRATLRLRYWLLAGRRELWVPRMVRDLALERDLIL